MKKLFVILIILLALVLRFWNLDKNPPSLDWDEASLGYNAYSIFKTGKDEYGSFLPLSIRSFNDYKPPLYTYFTVVPVFIFGLNEFSTRFISAFFGSLAVLVSFFLIKELFPRKSNSFYLLFLFFFAISPWHIQFCRVAFEANLALSFLIFAVWLFLLAIKKIIWLPISFIFFAFSLYAYHSPKLIVPFLLFGLFLIYRRILSKNIFFFFLSIFIFFIISYPIFGLQKTAVTARYGSVTVMNPDEKLNRSIQAIEEDQKRNDFLGKLAHNRRIVYAREIIGGYLDHFNFDFLFLTGDPPGRHHAVDMGMLYTFDLPLIILGIYYFLFYPSQGFFTIALWFFLAPIASSITTGTPHAVRAIFYLPIYQVLSAKGMEQCINLMKNKFNKTISQAFLLLSAIIIIFNFFYYLHMYWVHTPIEYSRWWQYGYKQVVSQIKEYEDNYQKIIVTYAYDQPYIYFLFYNQIDPAWYQKNWGEGELKRAERKFGKYEFRKIDWEKDSILANTLLVGTGAEIPDGASGLINEIYFLDNSIAFRIVGR